MNEPNLIAEEVIFYPTSLPRGSCVNCLSREAFPTAEQFSTVGLILWQHAPHNKDEDAHCGR